jgi:hypothetical protein
MARRRTGCITIEVTDFIDEVDDDTLLEEVKSRKLSTANEAYESCDLEIVREAYIELARGRTAEAKYILERLAYPKWQSKKQAELELARLKVS